MSDRPRNGFLRSLDERSFAILANNLTSVDLSVGQVLSEPGEPVNWIYLPENCLLSLLTETTRGDSVETAMIGVEGASGLIEACGAGRSDVRTFVQIDGRAFRAPAAVVRHLAMQDTDFAGRAWALAEFQLAESRRSGLCNALHLVEQRMARWLLECAERCGGRTQLPLTQEFLASMLGVQRTTVNGFAGELQRRGLISYARGRVAIMDAVALAQRACDCRTATQVRREQLGLHLAR